MRQESLFGAAIYASKVAMLLDIPIIISGAGSTGSSTRRRFAASGSEDGAMAAMVCLLVVLIFKDGASMPLIVLASCSFPHV